MHMERTGRSNGLMMGYFGNAEAPDAPFSFYYCDHLYSDSWNKTEPGGAPIVGDYAACFDGSAYTPPPFLMTKQSTCPSWWTGTSSSGTRTTLYTW